MAVISITGSTDRIGRATARVLLADGHRVLVHARSRERANPSRKHWVATSLCGVVSRARIMIESKDDMRKRRLPSPDRADTAAMLFSGRAQATLFSAGQLRCSR
jgi:NAD(P)-dependent dehydrogenase (short-subunit alcohol dehydrogenase family)